jgi:hypothetical protein
MPMSRSMCGLNCCRIDSTKSKVRMGGLWSLAGLRATRMNSKRKANPKMGSGKTIGFMGAHRSKSFDDKEAFVRAKSHSHETPPLAVP